MKKSVCWFLAVMLFCVVAYGGCGGGGSDNFNSQDSNTQSQDVTPTPTPTPTNPDTPATTTYSFSNLVGTWQASNGTGTATGDGLNATAVLSPEHDNTITFSYATPNGTLDGTSQIYWDAYQGSTLIFPDWEDEFGGASMSFSGLTFQNTSGNTWVMERTNKYNKITRTTITFTSSTTATVERYEDRDILVTGSYTLTKIADASETTTAYNLNGSWRVTAGTLTYQDGTTANYVQGSATADPFTIALTDIGDEKYILSLSAASGGFEKEGSPYCKASFGDSNQLVRVVWGTSEDWEYFSEQGWKTSIYELSNTNTYSAEFPATTHDVTTAAFNLTSASTATYTQTGPCLDTGDRDALVTVELTLTRVN